MTKRMIIILLLTGVVFGSVFGMKWFGNKMMVQFVEHMPVPPATIPAGAGGGSSSGQTPHTPPPPP